MQTMKTENINAIGTTADKTTFAGAGIAGGGWLTANELAALIGAMVAILSLMVSWYYKRQANLRLAAEHDLRQRERQMRIEMMCATPNCCQPPSCDTGPASLDEEQ